MKIFNIALASLKRQKGKKAFLAIALILGTATVITLFVSIDAQKSKIERQFDEYGANIIVTPRSDELSISYGGIDVSGVTANLEDLQLEDVEKIWSIHNSQNIRSVSPKLFSAVNVAGKPAQGDVVLLGVDFDQELKNKPWWNISGSVPGAENEVLIGSEVALLFGAAPGTTLIIDSSESKVAGVLDQTGSQDDSLIFGRYGDVSAAVGKPGAVSMVEVSALCHDCPIEEIIAQISMTLPGANVKGVQQVMKQRMETVGQFEQFALAVILVIVLLGAVLIFTSIMGSIADRRKEIGILSAIGFKKSHIIGIVELESLILALIAGAAGVVLSAVISYFVLPVFTDIDRSLVSIDPSLIISGIAAVTALGLTASLYPAIKASRIDPVTALGSL